MSSEQREYSAAGAVVVVAVETDSGLTDAQSTNRQSEAESIELPCPRRLVVRVMASTPAAHAQALAAVQCLLRHHGPNMATRLCMAPYALASIVRAELERLRSEGSVLHVHEGAAAAPARLYPVVFTFGPTASMDMEETEARVDKAVQRLETALRTNNGGSGGGASLAGSPTMVVSPWGSLDSPTAAPAAAPGGAGGEGIRLAPPPRTPQTPQTRQPHGNNTSIRRLVVPGRGTTHVMPTTPTPPAPLLESLRLLRDCFALELHGDETMQEGRDFFQAWALASLGGREHAAVVRARVAATIAGRGDLMEEAEDCVRRALGGGTAQDHLLRIANDMSLAGGSLEVAAAAMYDHVRIAVFDVDVQRLSTLAPPVEGPLPATREAALLHYQGGYWVLVPAGNGEMDMTMAGADHVLDASMLSASRRMSEA